VADSVRRPSAETHPLDICPTCKNALVLYAVDGSESACSDPACASAHGHEPPLRDWRVDWQRKS
jgi:hypothetical protein